MTGVQTCALPISGKYTIKIGKDEKLVSQLGTKDIEYLRGRPETLEEIAQAQLTEDELSTQALQSMVYLLGGISAGSKPIGDLQQLIRAGVETGNMLAVRGGRRLKPAIEKIDEGYSKIPELLNQLYSDMKDGIVTGKQIGRAHV